jgi:hypothetical protein
MALVRIANPALSSLSFIYSPINMVAIQILSFAALAIGYEGAYITTSSVHANSSDSTLAAPISSADVSKPFAIGISFKGEETLYLTNSAVASTKLADGIVCTITTTQKGEKTIGQLGCGPENKAFTYS